MHFPKSQHEAQEGLGLRRMEQLWEQGTHSLESWMTFRGADGGRWLRRWHHESESDQDTGAICEAYGLA